MSSCLVCDTPTTDKYHIILFRLLTHAGVRPITLKLTSGKDVRVDNNWSKAFLCFNCFDEVAGAAIPTIVAYFKRTRRSVEDLAVWLCEENYWFASEVTKTTDFARKLCITFVTEYAGRRPNWVSISSTQTLAKLYATLAIRQGRPRLSAFTVTPKKPLKPEVKTPVGTLEAWVINCSEFGKLLVSPTGSYMIVKKPLLETEGEIKVDSPSHLSRIAKELRTAPLKEANEDRVIDLSLGYSIQSLL